MKEYTYTKTVRPDLLQAELEDMGFLVEGVSTSGDQVTVYLADEETKDPADVVNVHEYELPETFNPYLYSRGKKKELSEGYGSVLKAVGVALGIPEEELTAYQQARTPEQILKDWVGGHRRYEDEWEAVAEVLKAKKIAEIQAKLKARSK